MPHVSVGDVDDWYEFVRRVFAEHPFAGGCGLSGPPWDAGHARVYHVSDPAGVLPHLAQFADGWNAPRAS